MKAIVTLFILFAAIGIFGQRNQPISVMDFLITEYTDSLQYRNSEANFNGIIKEVRPDGPKLIDELKPADFRVNVFSKIAEEVPSL